MSPGQFYWHLVTFCKWKAQTIGQCFFSIKFMLFLSNIPTSCSLTSSWAHTRLLLLTAPRSPQYDFKKSCKLLLLMYVSISNIFHCYWSWESCSSLRQVRGALSSCCTGKKESISFQCTSSLTHHTGLTCVFGLHASNLKQCALL